MPKSRPSFKEVHDVSSTSSVSRLRKKVRDLERLLKRTSSSTNRSKNSTALARREQERALRALKDELRTVERNMKEKKLDKRYHKVRFFERRKAARRVIKARKAVAVLGDEYDEVKRKMLEEERWSAETELAYVALFPREWKYVSLYVEGGVEKARKGYGESETEKKRLDWWTEVERMVKSGEVDVESLMFSQGDKRTPSARKIVKQAEEDEEEAELSEQQQRDDEDEFFDKQ
ncbi:uncharacterized protein V1513DRAFT_446604 [Lipomyces chichibuensis]|uniref:uncharacterized protein n=1 Tax=Lipomyces chichibuensis TaxID=1546026 RepID=UPI0033439E71